MTHPGPNPTGSTGAEPKPRPRRKGLHRQGEGQRQRGGGGEADPDPRPRFFYRSKDRPGTAGLRLNWSRKLVAARNPGRLNATAQQYVIRLRLPTYDAAGS